MSEEYKSDLLRTKEYTVTLEFTDSWVRLREKKPEKITLERDDFGVTTLRAYYDTHIVTLKGGLMPLELSDDKIDISIIAKEIKVEKRELDV